MKMKAKISLLAGAIALAGMAYMPQASAIVVTIGAEDSIGLDSGPLAQGSSTSWFDFKVSGSTPFSLLATGNSIASSATRGVQLTSFNLYDSTRTSVVATGSFAPNGPKFFAALLTAEPLAAGTIYSLGVGYNALGSNPTGNNWSASLSTAPVPEPEEWAMMLVGTGLVGYQVRRKQNGLRKSALA